MKIPAAQLLIFQLMIYFFSACGSQSSDFPSRKDLNNPLPPCPESPNCVRLTEQYPASVDATWEIALKILQAMKPYNIELTPDTYRIDAIFMVVFFQDDLTLQLEEAENNNTYLHIRSASRVGHSDFGVNRRRVRHLLQQMENRLVEADNNEARE
ncbi:DUF1499 domain-containing protein [Halalkalibaculum sp. DA3122]|uniref:DUF1499 domain-containing protein n=1 Tax=unclassified Halalkalibaculum TaxID=2964617 RepID=UPI0037547B3B